MGTVEMAQFLSAVERSQHTASTARAAIGRRLYQRLVGLGVLIPGPGGLRLGVPVARLSLADVEEMRATSLIAAATGPLPPAAVAAYEDAHVAAHAALAQCPLVAITGELSTPRTNR